MTDRQFWGHLCEPNTPARGQPHLQAPGWFSCSKMGLLDPTGDQGKDLGKVHAGPGCYALKFPHGFTLLERESLPGALKWGQQRVLPLRSTPPAPPLLPLWA